MPMLYSLGQHGALESIENSFQDDEHLFAYLDDLYVVCSPERVVSHLQNRRSSVGGARADPGPSGQNASVETGEEGREVIVRQDAALCRARVWRSQGPPAEQGIGILCIPIRHVDFVEAQLRATTEKHSVLYDRILHVQDLQSAWLLFLFCANDRAMCSLQGHPTF